MPEHAIPHPGQATIQYLHFLRAINLASGLGLGSLKIAALCQLPEDTILACMEEAGGNWSPFHGGFNSEHERIGKAIQIVADAWDEFCRVCGLKQDRLDAIRRDAWLLFPPDAIVPKG